MKKTNQLTGILALFRQLYQLNTNFSYQKLTAIEQSRQKFLDTQNSQHELLELIFALEETITELHT
ncbi:hypothetical protein HY484_03980 [Candidatus Woesearchaeota archaeon]|nr:hypothetical protein [Candidatus Woesearchaeota archaeon]